MDIWAGVGLEAPNHPSLLWLAAPTYRAKIGLLGLMRGLMHQKAIAGATITRRYRHLSLAAAHV
eukprot:5193846-Pyramimonas_sp.AAC.1